MTIRFIALLICIPGFAFAADDLTAIARDPHLLTGYITTHSQADFDAIRKILGSQAEAISLPPCETGQCHAEAIDVPGTQPAQAIVWSAHQGSGSAFWLRYRKDADGSWRFVAAFSVPARYFTPQHNLAVTFGRPFFVVDREGLTSRGLSTTREDWFDLSLALQKPVFSFTSDGAYTDHGRQGLAHLIKATAQAVKQGTAEQIRVEHTVHFQADALETTRPPLELGRGTATAYYVRQKTGEFTFSPALSSAPKGVLDSIFDLAATEDGGMTNEQFLKFDIAGLRRIAAAPRSTAGQWLALFLKDCRDTPEKTELAGLLQ